jgi:predicted nucleotidyltransferase
MKAVSKDRRGYDEATANFIGAACDLLLIAFPAEIHSIYLLGSWARHDEIATSDVDLLLVLNRRPKASKRAEIRAFISTLNRMAETRLDIGVYVRSELKCGVTPYMKRHKVLAGNDLLRGAPLISRPEAILLFAAQSLRFMRTARGGTKTLAFPLRYPSPSGRYHGYDTHGIRPASGGFKPGLNTLVNLVSSIATFRLLALGGTFPADKLSAAAAYRKHLPKDPWRQLVVETIELCRNRCQGRLPADRATGRSLSRLCRRILDLENDFLGTLNADLLRHIPRNDRDLRRRAAILLKSLKTR